MYQIRFASRFVVFFEMLLERDELLEGSINIVVFLLFYF